MNTATTKQKGNYGEYKADYNLLNNRDLELAGYDLEPIGRKAPTSPDDSIQKGIDGLYKNNNLNSDIKYVVDEAKFGRGTLSVTKDGRQMSDNWLKGTYSENDRILKAVNNDVELASDIKTALRRGQVERVLSKVDVNGTVITYKLNAEGLIIDSWP